jgi:hypothetical protein
MPAPKKPKAKSKTKAASEGVAPTVMLGEKPKGPGGRPSKYQQETHCDLAYKFSLLGATDEKIAELLNIAVSTLYEWKNTYEEFSEAIKNGKEIADAEVANSMYDQARNGNTTAGIFWLCNRQKDNWRQKQEISGPDGAALFQPVINVTTSADPVSS